MLARLVIALVRLYQRWLSPLLGNVCRFEPSCSRYAVACLEAHGAARGSALALRRLCKCHPFHPGGFDPPPPQRIQSIQSGGPATPADSATRQPPCTSSAGRRDGEPHRDYDRAAALPTATRAPALFP